MVDRKRLTVVGMIIERDPASVDPTREAFDRCPIRCGVEGRCGHSLLGQATQNDDPARDGPSPPLQKLDQTRQPQRRRNEQDQDDSPDGPDRDRPRNHPGIGEPERIDVIENHQQSPARSPWLSRAPRPAGDIAWRTDRQRNRRHRQRADQHDRLIEECDHDQE